MTNAEFFDWLRSMQDDKRLTQNEVDTANELLATTSPDELKAWLIDINGWRDTITTSHYMQLSSKGMDLLAQFEGFSSKPYQDSVGVWTIGYGNTYYISGKRVTANDPHLTRSQAHDLKKAIVNRDFTPSVNLALAPAIKKGWVNQAMFDACISLAYNIGVKGFANSSIAKKLNAGDKQGAANAFLLYNKAGGKVLQGLVNRRNAERKLFLS